MLPPFGGALNGGGGTVFIFKLAVSAGLLAMGLNGEVNHEDQTAVVALVAGTTGLASAIPAMDIFARKIFSSRKTQVPAQVPLPQRARPQSKRVKRQTIAPKLERKPIFQSSKTEHMYIPPTKTRREEDNQHALYGAALCTMVGIGTSIVIGRATNVKESTETLSHDALANFGDMISGSKKEETEHNEIDKVKVDNDSNGKLKNDFENNSVESGTDDGLKTLLHILSFLFTVIDATNKHSNEKYYSTHSATFLEAVDTRYNSNSVMALLILLYFFSAVHDAAHLETPVCSVDITWSLDLDNIMDTTAQLEAFRAFPCYWVDYSNTELEIPLPGGLVYPTVIPLIDILRMFGMHLSPNMHRDLVANSFFPFTEHIIAHSVSCQAVTSPFIETAYYVLWDRFRRRAFGLPKAEGDDDSEW